MRERPRPYRNICQTQALTPPLSRDRRQTFPLVTEPPIPSKLKQSPSGICPRFPPPDIRQTCVRKLRPQLGLPREQIPQFDKRVSSSGQGSYSTSTLQVDKQTITANYAGGTNYASGSSSATIMIAQ